MKGSSRFVIPVYQRNYEWSIENCKELFDDLIKVIKNNRVSHFFGSIVSVCDESGEEFLIIDGQQRLTTVSLLFLAMYHLLSDNKIKSAKNNLKEMIYTTYLIDEYAENDNYRMKLKPVMGDEDAYKSLFDNDSDKVYSSPVIANYKYFCGRILDFVNSIDGGTVDDLFDAIKKLEIIKITLNGDDNPQLIFESLNSTGVALSESDKIRNFVLMGLDKKRQEVFYNKYWRKIEQNTGSEIDMFVRDYLSVKQGATPKFSAIYKEFKNFTADNTMSLEEQLADMLFYSKLYQKLLTSEVGDSLLNMCLYRLNRLETTVARPFFLEILRMHEQNEVEMTTENLKEIFNVIETYYYRRTACHVPTNALNKIFLTLHKDVVRCNGTTDNYVDKVKYVLLSKREGGRCPNDIEFLEAFETNQVYTGAQKAKNYLLERLENFGTRETKDVYKKLDDGEYTIEHIMPQKITPEWQKELGEGWQRVYDTWLHRIANLTLTAYNSKYSNKLYKVKKTVENGFAESGLRMNQKIVSIAKNDVWGLKELESRNIELKQQALKIWPMPVTSFKPTEIELEHCALDTSSNLTGRELSKFSFMDEMHEGSGMNWISMYKTVLKELYFLDSSILTRIASANSQEFGAWISVDKSKFREPEEIETGIFIEKNISTTRKVTMLNDVFSVYGIQPSELVFYFKDKKDTDV